MISNWILSAEAEVDLKSQADYYGEFSDHVAEQFWVCAFRMFDVLAENPGAGRPRPDLSTKIAGLRSHRIKGFGVILVFYAPHGDLIRIVRILHGAMDLGQQRFA